MIGNEEKLLKTNPELYLILKEKEQIKYIKKKGKGKS